MATAFAKEAQGVHRQARLSDQLIARATTAKPSTVRAWLARSSPARTLVSPHHRVENCRFGPRYVAKI